jgi:hypothetical protein
MGNGGGGAGLMIRAQTYNTVPNGGQLDEVLTSDADGVAFWGTPAGVAGSLYGLSGAASGDGLAYTASNADFTGAVGSILVFLCPTVNTGNVTLDVSGEGVRSVLTNGGAQIPAGLLQSGRTYFIRRHNSTQYRMEGIDITRAEQQLALYRSGTQRGQVSVTSNNELSLQSWVDGAMVEVGRFDTATGNLRLFYTAGYGATAATFSEFYSARNPQTVVADDAHYDAMAKSISNAAMFEFSDQIAPYTLATTDPYYLNGGDSLKTIRVTVASAYIDAQFMPIGATMEIAATSTGSFSVYCGPGNQWRTFSSTQLTLGFASGQVVQVKRYSQTDFLAIVLVGSAATPSTAAPVTRDITIVNAGQSNGVKLITEGGLAGLQQGFSDLSITDTVWWVQAASGESALLEANVGSDPNNYWWTTAGGPGPLATALVSAVNAAVALGQPAPTALLWDQGEKDTLTMATSGDTTPATYLAALEDLFAWFRDAAQLNDATLPIFITPLGSSDLGSSFDAGVTAVREAQLKYIASDAYAYQNAERYDLSRPYSNVHLNYAGQREQGLRVAKVLGNVLYAQSNELGPEIISWTELTSTTYKAVVDPGANTSMENDGNPIAAIGFALCSNADAMAATYYAIDSITRFYNSGTGYHEFTITSAAAATGARLIYPHGALAASRTGRIIKGTVSTLPLRSWNSTP